MALLHLKLRPPQWEDGEQEGGVMGHGRACSLSQFFCGSNCVCVSLYLETKNGKFTKIILEFNGTFSVLWMARFGLFFLFLSMMVMF